MIKWKKVNYGILVLGVDSNEVITNSRDYHSIELFIDYKRLVREVYLWEDLLRVVLLIYVNVGILVD